MPSGIVDVHMAKPIGSFHDSLLVSVICGGVMPNVKAQGEHRALEQHIQAFPHKPAPPVIAAVFQAEYNISITNRRRTLVTKINQLLKILRLVYLIKCNFAIGQSEVVAADSYAYLKADHQAVWLYQ